jgi:hypothetical protein
VPETNMTLLHKNKMVLPEYLSMAIQNMAKGGGDSYNNRTNSVVINVNGPLDRVSAETVRDIAHQVKLAIRRGELSWSDV